MSNLNSRLVYEARRLGWPAVVGVMLILGTILFYIMVGKPVEHKLHALEAGTMRMRTAIARHQSSWVQESPHSAMQVFYQSLPSESAIPGILEKLFDAAYENNLAVDTGEFQLLHEKESSFSRYQIFLPVQGTYPDIRRFVNWVLKEFPSAALDDISFGRDDVKSPELEAKVRLTIYVGIRS